ncbi:MAG: hypothetical protein ACRCX2_03805 [Paraclostridium sp.]
MLENLLKDLLQLETREDFRDYNEGNMIALDLNKTCDLAYIRVQFKRALKGNQGLILTDSKNNNTRLDFTNSYATLEGRSKILKSIQNWINNCYAEGLAPQKISFY